MAMQKALETLGRWFHAGHVDLGFYERFYRPEALSDTQRRHRELWHA